MCRHLKTFKGALIYLYCDITGNMLKTASAFTVS